MARDLCFGQSAFGQLGDYLLHQSSLRRCPIVGREARAWYVVCKRTRGRERMCVWVCAREDEQQPYVCF